MEETLKAIDRVNEAIDAALAQRQATNDLIDTQAAIIQEQKALILELELERATLLVVLQRLRDGRAEGEQMSAKATPGPWKLEPHRSEDHCEMYVSSDTDEEGGWAQLATVIVRMLGDDADDPAGIANAKLIVAAPDLADVVAMYSREHDAAKAKAMGPEYSTVECDCDACCAADDALRKAGRIA